MATGIPLIDVPLWLLGLELDPGYEEVGPPPLSPAAKKAMEEQTRAMLRRAALLCLGCGQKEATTRNYFGERVCDECEKLHPKAGSPYPLAQKPL